MKYSAIKFVPLLCVVGLSGCGTLFGENGYFRDRGDDYLKAESMPPMKVPESADESVFGQLYVIPDIDRASYDYPREFVAPRPEALSSNVYSESIKIQKLGDNRWIFVNASPSEVWPRVRNFLNTIGVEVARTDAPRGIIETSWLTFKDDPDSRDKYRLRIEQGVQPESAEIHVTHLAVPGDSELPALVSWPPQSSSAEREAWMVDELASNLAGQMGSASASLLAQTIGGEEKVSIVVNDGEPILRMELGLLRARATLNHALQQEGLQIIDDDSSSGIYYVQRSDLEQSDGWFSGWFSRDKTVENYELEDLLRHMNLADTPANRALFPPQAFAPSDETLKDVPGYLFIVSENDGVIDVRVRDAYGQPLASRDGRELLGLVRRNLI